MDLRPCPDGITRPIGAWAHLVVEFVEVEPKGFQVNTMYLFNKIVDFMAFLCRVGNVTPESVRAHNEAGRPRQPGDTPPIWQLWLRRLFGR